jgi:hypothetical protein
MRILLACAACYGQSDSAMAAGMNWGILSLLVIITCVLGGVAAFFVFLARRASRTHAAAAVPSFDTNSAELGIQSARKVGLGLPQPHRTLRAASAVPPASHACCGRGKTETRFSV